MKQSIFTLLLIANIAAAQYTKRMPYACELITSTDLNSLLGTIVKEDSSTLPGAFCPYRSLDNGVQVTVQYVGLADSTAAISLLKANATGNMSDIANKGITGGSFTQIVDFSSGGNGANYLTGRNELRGPLVRLQVVLGKYLVTFDTEGIPVSKVESQLPAIYGIIKKNSGF